MERKAEQVGCGASARDSLVERKTVFGRPVLDD
ncbi:hypothetical protein ES703_38848 [subsurface metagenome]